MRRRPSVEQLEDRTLLAGHTLATATALNFTLTSPNQMSSVSGFLTSSAGVDMYALTLSAGDTVTIRATARQFGSGLDSCLRIFDSIGNPLFVNDDNDGTDAGLTFQAQGGTYYVGVSSDGNGSYDPAQAPMVGDSSRAGYYILNLSRTNAALLPDLVGAAFQITSGPAVWGDLVTVDYRIENRGGTAATAFDTELRLSTNNRIESGDVALQFMTSPGGPLVSALSLAGLAAGGNIQGTLYVQLPMAPPGGFLTPQAAFLGLRVDHLGAVAESGEANNASQRRGSDWDNLSILVSQAESALNDTPPSATPIGLDARTSGTLGGADVRDYFRIDIVEPGTLTVRAHGIGFDTRLSLHDVTENLLIESEGEAGSADDLIIQGLSPGTYYIAVQNRTGGSGSNVYELTTQFTPGNLLSQPIGGTGQLLGGISVDLNGDGKLDLATPVFTLVSVFLGNGDGSFGAEQQYGVGYGVFSIASADFNLDGIPDLITPDQYDLTLSLLLGNGDGTFQARQVISLPSASSGLVAGDFNSDGRPDLISNGLTLLLGNGDGTFQAPQAIASGGVAFALLAVDFNADGRLDLGTFTYNVAGDGFFAVLLGNGDGTFQAPQESAISSSSVSSPASNPVASFLDGDAFLDVVIPLIDVAGSAALTSIAVLRGNGNGTFQPVAITPLGRRTEFIALGDFTGDGRIDVTGAGNGRVLALLPGNGDGTLQAPRFYSLTDEIAGIIAGDFNRDGVVDAAYSNSTFQTASVFLGGGGQFLNATPLNLGGVPSSAITGDFNKDGRLDLAMLSNVEAPDIIMGGSSGPGQVDVLLGKGDGTFQPARSFLVGAGALALAAGDVNGDGRIDLATINAFDGTISLLLGNGDGSFQSGGLLLVAGMPLTLKTGDFNNDGRLDLLVSYDPNPGSLTTHSVAVYLGNGNGTFQAPLSIGLGAIPEFILSLTIADFDQDGRLDFASDLSGNRVGIFLGAGDGTFAAPVTRFFIDSGALLAADFNNNGVPDLAVADGPIGSDRIRVALGLGDGTFSGITQVLTVPTGSASLMVAGDYNGDTFVDLIAISADPAAAATLAVFLGNGNGTFTTGPTLSGNTLQMPATPGDFNRDGNLDLAVGSPLGIASVLLGDGTGELLATGQAKAMTHSAPVLGFFTNPTAPDAFALRDNGEILFRGGQPNQPGTFAAPIVVNPGAPARDFTLLLTDQGWQIAALNLATDVASGGTSTMSLYRLTPDGTFTRTHERQRTRSSASSRPASWLPIWSATPTVCPGIWSSTMPSTAR